MRSRRFHAGLGLLGLGLVGCGGLDPVAPRQQITDPAKLYMSLDLDHRVVNLATVAPYDTLQLTAIPRNGVGEPMSGLPAPTFRLVTGSDSQFVTLTPQGLLRAREANDPFSPVRVSAELTDSMNVKNAIVIDVNVTDGPPVLMASLAFNVSPSDSNKSGMFHNADFAGFTRGRFILWQTLDNLRLLTGEPPFARALDAAGGWIPGLLIRYTSLDPTITESPAVSRGIFEDPYRGIVTVSPGKARLLAETTAYGVTKSDTIVYTVTWPTLAFVVVRPGLEGAPPVFEPQEIRIAPHGVVMWQSVAGDTVDVTFDDPTHVAAGPTSICDVFDSDPETWGAGPACGSGNFIVPAMPTDPAGATYPWQTDRVRQFAVPGVYRYHSATGATGRIIVTNDPDPTKLP